MATAFSVIEVGKLTIRVGSRPKKFDLGTRVSVSQKSENCADRESHISSTVVRTAARRLLANTGKLLSYGKAALAEGEGSLAGKIM